MYFHRLIILLNPNNIAIDDAISLAMFSGSSVDNIWIHIENNEHAQSNSSDTGWDSSTDCQSDLAIFVVDGQRNTPNMLVIGQKANCKGNGRIGSYQLPPNQTMLWESAETYLVPPLLMGSSCSDVCQVVGRQLQHFQLLAFAAGCNSDVLANDRRFPNLYRVVSDSDSVDITSRFINHLQWDFVAFISDSSKLNMLTTEETMIKLQSNNVTIAGVEVFISDPTEAVERIKSKGVRVVIVNCFFDLCPLVACAAYKAGFYGGRVIWIFSAVDDFTKTANSTACNAYEMSVMREHSFFHFASSDKIIEKTSTKYYSHKLNFVFQDLEDYLTDKIPGIQEMPFYWFRFMCIDNIAPSIFILDELEKKLNNKRKSLADVIGIQSMQYELMEMARDILESLNFNLFGGPFNFDGDRVNVPAETGFTQYQNGVYEEIFVSSPSKAVVEIKWKTSDGSKPKARPSDISLTRKGVFWSNLLLTVLNSLFIIFLLGLMAFHWRINQIGKVEKLLQMCIFIGLLFYTIPMVLLLAIPLHLQCSVAPILVTFGFTLQTMSMLSRIPISPDGTRRQIDNVIWLLTSLFVNAMLLTFW